MSKINPITAEQRMRVVCLVLKFPEMKLEEVAIKVGVGISAVYRILAAQQPPIRRKRGLGSRAFRLNREATDV
jgi:hypothetical protein